MTPDTFDHNSAERLFNTAPILWRRFRLRQNVNLARVLQQADPLADSAIVKDLVLAARRGWQIVGLSLIGRILAWSSGF